MKPVIQIAAGIIIAAVVLGLTQCTATIGSLSLLSWLHSKNQQAVEEEKRKTMIAAEEQRRINEQIARVRTEEDARRKAEEARALRERQAAWEKYYKPIPACKAATSQEQSWEEFMKCQTDQSRQRSQFDTAYQNNPKMIELTTLKQREQTQTSKLSAAKDNTASQEADQNQCEHWKDLWKTDRITEKTEIVAENIRRYCK